MYISLQYHWRFFLDLSLLSCSHLLKKRYTITTTIFSTTKGRKKKEGKRNHSHAHVHTFTNTKLLLLYCILFIRTQTNL